MRKKGELLKKTAVLLAAGGMVCLFEGHRKEKKRMEKVEKRHEPYGSYERYWKRPLDVACALTALLLLSPIMAVLWLLVRFKLGSPALFCQERPGKDEQIFKLYKFRTMTEERDEEGKLLLDEKRLTEFGAWLRSTSLDELPELFNILKGDMSFVGPRPLLVKYLPLYNEKQKHRHDVKPGLTGLAQVHGRNAISWEEKFRMDAAYVNRITFFGDAKILFQTIEKVFIQRDGISSHTSATMETFTGTKEL